MKRMREFSLAAIGSALWWLMEHVLDKSVGNIMEVCIHIIGHG